MPPRDWAFRVQDILEAIAKIQRYISGVDFVEIGDVPLVSQFDYEGKYAQAFAV